MTIHCRILKLDIDRFQVDLSCRGSDLRDEIGRWKTQLDLYYDFDAERADKQKSDASQKNSNRTSERKAFFSSGWIHPLNRGTWCRWVLISGVLRRNGCQVTSAEFIFVVTNTIGIVCICAVTGGPEWLSDFFFRVLDKCHITMRCHLSLLAPFRNHARVNLPVPLSEVKRSPPGMLSWKLDGVENGKAGAKPGALN